MTIAQLIEELQKHDPTRIVVHCGYEGGREEIRVVKPIKLNLNVNDEWYYGPHEESSDGDIDALLIA